MKNKIHFIENFLLTITNLASLPALYLCIVNKHYIQAISLGLATVASMNYHWSEPERTKPHTEKMLKNFYPSSVSAGDSKPEKIDIKLKLDQFFALLAMVVFANKQFILDHWTTIVSLFGIMIASDLVYWLHLDKIKKSIIKLILHCPWHIGALGYLPYVYIMNPIYHTTHLFY